MIRATAFATGLFVLLCGSTLLLIDQILLTRFASDRLAGWLDEPEPGPQIPRPEVPPASDLSPVANAGSKIPTLALLVAPTAQIRPTTVLPGHAADADDLPPGWRFRYVAQGTESSAHQQVIDPPDWAAAVLLSLGGLVLVYALSLPRRRYGYGYDDRHGHFRHGRNHHDDHEDQHDNDHSFFGRRRQYGH